MNKFILFSLFVFFTLSSYLQAQLPTKSDLRYSQDFKRSILDLWIAKSEKPTPLVVNFHGGGFRVGDKRLFNRNPILKKYLPEGVSFASVNYPFVQQVNGNYSQILEHCAESIQFLKKNAKLVLILTLKKILQRI